MEKQTKFLYENATSRNDKVRAALFQAMRWVAIHPTNDGNKRMFKMIMNHNLSDQRMIPDINKKWDNVAGEVFKQAVHGNDLSGMLKATEEIYGVQLDVQEHEVPPFKIMPEADHSEPLGLDKSRIHGGKKFSKNSNYVKIDQAHLIKAKKDLSFFDFKEKKAISKLQYPLSAKLAMKEVNKLSGKVNKETLNNLRYSVAVAESGYQPFLKEAMEKGILDPVEKAKFIRPIVVKAAPNINDLIKKEIQKIFAEKKNALAKAQSNTRSIRTRTEDIKTTQVTTKV